MQNLSNPNVCKSASKVRDIGRMLRTGRKQLVTPWQSMVRAPLMISRKSHEGSDPSAPPVVDEPQSTPNRRTAPPFARSETYTHVRAMLMRQGWDPVVSLDADQCMPDDSRCAGRPEILTCSGSGLAMCRFRWQRDEQSLTTCTAGEEQEMFHSVCE